MHILQTRNGNTDLAPLHGRLNRLFGDGWGNGLFDGGLAAGFVPALDAYQTPDAFVMMLDVTGIDPDSLEISVTSDEVTISGERTVFELPEKATWIARERRVGKFSRKLTLGVPVDAEAVEARAKNGVLVVRLPKRAEALPRQISVTAE